MRDIGKVNWCVLTFVLVSLHLMTAFSMRCLNLRFNLVLEIYIEPLPWTRHYTYISVLRLSVG
jgi:hypothetical protein